MDNIKPTEYGATNLFTENSLLKALRFWGT